MDEEALNREVQRRLAKALTDRTIARTVSHLEDMLGDDAVGLAKDWVGSRKPPELCLELFARLTRVVCVVDAICYFMGSNMDEIVALAARDRRRVKDGLKSLAGGNDGVKRGSADLPGA